jgi:hypothetical protein
VALVDRRVEELMSIHERTRSASTLREALELSHSGHGLAVALQEEHKQVEEIARGWVYMAPPRCS